MLNELKSRSASEGKKIALIGYGYWGQNLLRNLFDVQNCEVAYCADKNKEALSLAKKRYPSLNVTTNINKALSDSTVDAIVIATPTHTHFQIAKKALLNGKDVLLEKPMVSTVKQARELNKIARDKKRIIMIDFTFLFNDAVVKIKNLIDNGELGDVLYIHSMRTNLGIFQPDVNVIFDLASHDFSIANFLIGKKPLSVQAEGLPSVNHQEAVGNIVIEYPKGVKVFIHVSWLSPLKVRRMTIVGTKKMVIYDDLEPAEKVRVYDKGITKTNVKETEQIKIGYRSGDVWLPKIDITEALKIMISEFIKAITTREIKKSSGEFGLSILEMLEASTKSLKYASIQRLKNR